jgi:hypothetical protein
VSLHRPRGERTEPPASRCSAASSSASASAPEGPGRRLVSREDSCRPGASGVPETFGRRLIESVHAEITLRGRSDDARAAEAGRMTCSGRLDAADSEIERQFVN